MNFSPYGSNPVVFARYKVYPVILMGSPSSASLIQNRLRSVKAVRKEKEWLWRKGFVKEMSF